MEGFKENNLELLLSELIKKTGNERNTVIENLDFQKKLSILCILSKKIHTLIKKTEFLRDIAKDSFSLPENIKDKISNLKKWEEKTLEFTQNGFNFKFEINHPDIVLYISNAKEEIIGEFKSRISHSSNYSDNYHREVSNEYRGLGFSKIYEEFVEIYCKTQKVNNLNFSARKYKNWTWAISNGYMPTSEEDANYILINLLNEYDKLSIGTETDSKYKDITLIKKV